MPEASEGDCHTRQQRGRGAWGPRERVSNAHGKHNSANVLDGLPADREARTGRRARPERPLVSAVIGDAQIVGPAIPPWRRRRAQEGGARVMLDAGSEATRGGRRRGRVTTGDADGRGGRPCRQDSDREKDIKAQESDCKITNNAHLAARTIFSSRSTKIVVSKLFY